MIVNHQHFQFRNKCLVEKVQVKAPFRFELDFPMDACFIHFKEGNTTINASTQQVTLNAKESVVLKCGRYFSNLQPIPHLDSYEVIVVHLSRELLTDIYQTGIPTVTKSLNSSIQKISEQALITEFINSLEFYFQNPQIVNDQLLELKVKELILLLIQTSNSESILTLFSQLFTNQETNLKEIVNAHLFSDCTVQDLAYLAHMSESTFKRRFKELYHDSPANFFKVKRLERAAELLSLPNLTITEITFQVGLNDVAHFSRSFKSMYGCSPKSYCEQYIDRIRQ